MFQPSAWAPAQATGIDKTVSPDSTILDLFRLQVLSRPFATALEAGEKAFTYSFLNSQVDRLASFLRVSGIQRGDVVALCLRRTENLVIGMLAVLRAGAAYLPLNPTDPALRLGSVIAHASARCVLTDTRSVANLPAGLSQVVLLDHPFAQSADADLYGLPDAAGADLAYVIYTSGTTGMPKGVEITHASLLNVVADVAERLGFSEDDSWIAVTTVSFDIAALELLLPLCYGGRVILASEEQARVGRMLVSLLQQKKPTVMQATPITWRILIESGWVGGDRLTIISGGDRMERVLAEKLLARASSVWNMYGPTETTIWSTADRLSLEDEAVTIGTPIANTEVYILDGQTKLSSEIGEICIGGAGVARGYVRDPQLTSLRFVDIEAEGSGTTRVYRTGDLGRWNAQGKLEFHGRIDHQVKINGFRIELAEIEGVIREFPGIADVAVLGVEGASNQKRLYAFVVCQGNVAITADEIADDLMQRLPRYMIPERFWFLERLPTTVNSKRDVNALKALVIAPG